VHSHMVHANLMARALRVPHLWRHAGLAMAARDYHAILFSMNVLNGGTQDKDGTWDCTRDWRQRVCTPRTAA
jgi:hypothetical protein